MFSPLEQFDVISFFHIFDLPFLSTLLPFVLLLVLFVITTFLLKHNLKLIPRSINVYLN